MKCAYNVLHSSCVVLVKLTAKHFKSKVATVQEGIICMFDDPLMTINIIVHRRRNHGGSGGSCPPMFSDSYIARLNFIHSDHIYCPCL